MLINDSERENEKKRVGSHTEASAGAKSEHKCKRVMKGTGGWWSSLFLALSSMVVSALLFSLLFPSRTPLIIRYM